MPCSVFVTGAETQHQYLTCVSSVCGTATDPGTATKYSRLYNVVINICIPWLMLRVPPQEIMDYKVEIIDSPQLF